MTSDDTSDPAGLVLYVGGLGKIRGFTLIELMVTLAVLGILLGLAAPSFYNATLGSKLGSFANDLVGSVHLARSEAIKRNSIVTLCVSIDGTTCTSGDWAQGWIVAVGSTTLLRQEALPAGFKVTNGNVNSLSFQPSGLGATLATFTVCRAAPTVGAQERRVAITAMGRVSVSTTRNGACS